MAADLSRLEPLRAQERCQEINEQQQCHNGGKPNHGISFHTRSHAATKAKISPRVAKPRTNIAGSQIVRSIVNPLEARMLISLTFRATGMPRTGRFLSPC